VRCLDARDLPTPLDRTGHFLPHSRAGIGNMNLYHHTDPTYLPSILEHGLIARPWAGGNDDPTLSAILHNRSVVWLTTQPSPLLTEADIGFLRQQGREGEVAAGMWMSRNGGNVSLKIDIPKHSKKLFHYLTWVKKNEAVIVSEDGTAYCNDDGELMTTARLVSVHLPSSARWYVHFGDIPPKRITAL
jgi:hypothetical protein